MIIDFKNLAYTDTNTKYPPNISPRNANKKVYKPGVYIRDVTVFYTSLFDIEGLIYSTKFES